MSKRPTTQEEIDKAILRHCRRGRTISTLSEFLDMPASYVSERLSDLRKRGLVLCTNKLWYRKDIELRLLEPRPPVLTEADLKFLARQGRLFD